MQLRVDGRDAAARQVWTGQQQQQKASHLSRVCVSSIHHQFSVTVLHKLGIGASARAALGYF